MLKVHPTFKIYGIGFLPTLKSLVNQKFVQDCELSDVEIYHVTEAEINESYETTYHVRGHNQPLSYREIYEQYQPSHLLTLVAVCYKDSDGYLKLEGFIVS